MESLQQCQLGIGEGSSVLPVVLVKDNLAPEDSLPLFYIYKTMR